MSRLLSYEEAKTAGAREWGQGLKEHMKKSIPTALVFGVGTAAGGAAGTLASKLYAQHHAGQKIPLKYLAVAAPLVGGLLAKIYHDAHDSADPKHDS